MVSDEVTVADEFREFVYSVSHDLWGPAQAVVAFTRLLKSEQSGAFSDDGQLYFSLIVENARKLQEKLDGLLTYSRLNTVARSPRKVDCNRIVAQCWEQLETEVKTADAKLEVKELPWVFADPAQISQLFFYLIDNAVKFRDPHKPLRLDVSVTKTPAELLFAFRDSGIGIGNEFYEDIFRIFRKLHPDEEYPGAGVGLALAKKIVTQHGGRIWVESVPGQGSLFQFTLPSSGSRDG